MKLQENHKKPKTPKEVLLNHSEPKDARIQAAFRLMNDPSDEALETLIEALFTDPSPIVRHECAFALGETASKKVVPYLIKSMETDPNPFVVHEAALALGTLGDKRAVEPLKKLLNHENPDIKESAEIALERIFADYDNYFDERPPKT